MENLKLRTCCFFGHRKVEEVNELKLKLSEEVEGLIVKDNVDTFLFGSKSQFDDLCYNVVAELKGKYPHIKRVYVRAAYADIDNSYTNYLLGKYEETYFPERLRGAGKAAYVERNQEMIDKADICVVYYDKNYVPQSRRNGRRVLSNVQPKSGTAIAYNYAMKKNKIIINMRNCEDEKV